MSSSTPWITDSKYDSIWHYSEFARWVVENRELIKDNMIDKNNIREQGNRGIGYVKPQMDEIMVFQKRNRFASYQNNINHTYYYWFNYTDSPSGIQYLIDDGIIDDFLSVGDLESRDYTKLRRRVQTPNITWMEGGFRTDWNFYRIKFKDIMQKTTLINWNYLPWGDVK